MPSNETMAVGQKLVGLCREGKNLDAIDQLYSPDIVSVEASPDGPLKKIMSGIDDVRGKNLWWYENHEVHGGEVDGPYPLDDRFITFMKFDITPKTGPMAGNRMQVQEMGLYTVADGKITKEEFFYDMG